MFFHMIRLDSGSTPVDGSSRRRILGWCISAQAKVSFRLFPPESFVDIVLRYLPRPKRLQISSVGSCIDLSDVCRDLLHVAVALQIAAAHVERDVRRVDHSMETASSGTYPATFT